METFKDLGSRLSNWRRWGPGDQRGTLNLVTPERVKAAAGSIRTGRTFELSLPLDSNGPQQNAYGRYNPIHSMIMLPGDLKFPEGMFVADDQITMPLQCATQWDSLAHVGYDGMLFNGVAASESLSAFTGASQNDVANLLPGVVGRGVLLDLARHRGVDWIEAEGAEITPAELEGVEAAQGVHVGEGDILLFRTGWRRKAIVDGWSAEWLSQNPGLGLGCAEWLHKRGVSALASDNFTIEIFPSRTEDATLPLHCVLIRDLGMPLGEMFDLEELATDCANDGQWDFFFSDRKSVV